jgi:hypothetical protein
MDWIQGEKFQTLANNNTIFYCDVHDVRSFVETKRNHAPYVLIAHNSDNCIDFTIPENVIRLYSQNVNICDARIESIPIGLENSRWFKHERKREKILDTLQKPKQIKNKVYVNHNILTNPTERTKPYKILKDLPYVTMVHGENGKGYDDYLQNIYNHLFIVCPEGNGIDTHRTWECLYLNTIPIEKRNINNQFYVDLPICFVNDWTEITEEFLDKEYIRIKTQFWNMEKVTFAYWENKIKNTHI